MGFLSSIEENWDTLSDSGFSESLLIPKFENWFLNAKDSVNSAMLEDGYYWQHENSMSHIVSILSDCETFQNHELVTSTKFIELEFSPSSYLIYKMKKGIEISEEEWTYAEEYGWGMFEILLEFHKSDNSKLIPKSLRSKEKLTELALIEMLLDDWGDVEIIKHLGTKQFSSDGEEKSFVFMLIKDNYDPDLEYVGCVESIDFENLEELNSLWELIYDYSYNEVKNGNYKEKIDEILGRYE